MMRSRLAWFSPMPPVRSGVAACSADLVPALRAFFDIDVFVDVSTTSIAPGVIPGMYSAHEFVWRHQQGAYTCNGGDAGIKTTGRRVSTVSKQRHRVIGDS